LFPSVLSFTFLPKISVPFLSVITKQKMIMEVLYVVYVVKPAYVLDEPGHGSPTSNSPASTDTSVHTTATYNYPDYALRSPRMLSRTLQHLSIRLRGGVMWNPTTSRLHDVQYMQQNGHFKSRLETALLRATKTCHPANQRGALSHAQQTASII
jgi:hypothetical protein